MDIVIVFFKKNLNLFLKVFIFFCFLAPAVYFSDAFISSSSYWNLLINKFQDNKPKTLQKIKGSLLGDGLDIYVLKIKHRRKIYLDFLSKNPKDETFYLINSVTLKGSYDGFFEYWGETLSLALIDDDGDGFLEVIAPTFDQSLKPHLNMVKYNIETKKFELKKALKKYPVFR